MQKLSTREKRFILRKVVKKTVCVPSHWCANVIPAQQSSISKSIISSLLRSTRKGGRVSFRKKRLEKLMLFWWKPIRVEEWWAILRLKNPCYRSKFTKNRPNNRRLVLSKACITLGTLLLTNAILSLLDENCPVHRAGSLRSWSPQNPIENVCVRENALECMQFAVDSLSPSIATVLTFSWFFSPSGISVISCDFDAYRLPNRMFSWVISFDINVIGR